MPGKRAPRRGSDPQEMERLREAKTRFEEDLLSLAGVHGLGIGYKIVGKREIRQLAIVVLVESKVAKSRLDPRQQVPERLTFVSAREGREITVVTDVQEAARAIPGNHLTAADIAQLRSKLRPSPGGVFIASPVGSGTLGGWALDDVTGQFVFLSNRHVLGSTSGALVMQPLFPLPGDPNDYRFGTVLRASTAYDATIGVPLSRADVKTEIFGNGPAIYEIAEATLGMEVEKTGASTGHTEGRVDLVDVTTVAPCERSRTAFRIAPTATPTFTQTGDSGSVIVERTNPGGMSWKRVVGLLYCMTETGSLGYAHQITDVFADLSLITVCEALARIIDAIFRSATEPAVSEPRGFGRDFAARLAAGRVGREVVKTVSTYRASAVKLILEGDGQRALEAALYPLLRGAVITDDVLDRVITDEDVSRFTRVFAVAERVAPEAKPALRQARSILSRTRNQSVRSVLLDETPRGGR